MCDKTPSPLYQLQARAKKIPKRVRDSCKWRESFLNQLKDFYFLSLQLDELEGFGLKMLLNLKFYSRFLEAWFVSDVFS